MRKRILALGLAVALLLTACGSKTAATTMHLKRTEGTVGVSDDGGKDVTPREDLGLYSGYGVDTQAESYAWIDLDEVKLTKMDQDSEIAITKEGKKLEIEVKSGSLFFNVTQPLADDETMTIRTSSMTVGIRGTCGWVEVPDGNTMKVYLLEGKVECTAGTETAAVSAGEMAAMTVDSVTVAKFTARDVPDFVVEEVENGGGLAETILDASGIDVLNPAGPEELAMEQYRAVIAQADSYFNDEYFGDDVPTISYTYALAPMQREHQIPALVLKKETVSYWGGDMSNAVVFQYDPDRGTVIQAEGSVSEGVASAGGYRGTLAMSGDGVGLLETSWSSGSGMGAVVRVTLAGDRLQSETLFDGFLFDGPGSAVDQISSLPIDWHNIDDLSGLDSWTPTNSVQPAQPDAGSESGNILAAYVGEYTPYEYVHGSYGGGRQWRGVTLDENGVITGGGTDWYTLSSSGTEPSSITQEADGSIVIAFSEDEFYTIYPAGVVPEGYDSDYWRSQLDLNTVNLRYFLFDGGVMDILYRK